LKNLRDCASTFWVLTLSSNDFAKNTGMWNKQLRWGGIREDISDAKDEHSGKMKSFLASIDDRV
jgi:hypothetical protein